MSNSILGGHSLRVGASVNRDSPYAAARASLILDRLRKERLIP